MKDIKCGIFRATTISPFQFRTIEVEHGAKYYMDYRALKDLYDGLEKHETNFSLSLARRNRWWWSAYVFDKDRVDDQLIQKAIKDKKWFMSSYDFKVKKK
jgi:hypothetical protein